MTWIFIYALGVAVSSFVMGVMGRPDTADGRAKAAIFWPVILMVLAVFIPMVVGEWLAKKME